ncbi:polysaccharide biosynthesis/export family protein [Parvularcula sp. IMCC14364]|uniref:polysaccharide biosynthesis/export family protein n=1 Tax=Parvularcula sp. IMCC14364 TaxID=3067902 RepID=UPI002740BADA|nr:polysaccharide biosynthesis/export family protein [Parvularcula sp. IMCC14364]
MKRTARGGGLGYLPVLLAMASCASGEPAQSKQLDASDIIVTSELPQPDAEAISRLSQNDIFRAGDTVEMIVYRPADLSGTFVVNAFGKVEFPLIGEQQVENVTVSDLSETLEARYEERYLKDPDIVVKRVAAKIGKFVVDGAVGKPGVYDLYEAIRLSEAIALAGGTDDVANLRRILVLRNIGDERYVSEYNMVAIREKGGQDPLIYPNDAIFVDNRRVSLAVGEILRTVPLFGLFLR